MDHDASKPVRVLLVDDDEDDYLIIKRTFARMKDSLYTLEWVNTFERAKAAIEQDAHDVYLIDYRLGEESGLDLLKAADAAKRPQPFILLTGAGNEEVEWRSLELAAADYLIKGSFDSNLLSRTLYYALQRKRVEEQRVSQLVELSRSKDEFISIASHQLRTPATSVKQYVGMLLEGFAGDLSLQQRELLEKAYSSNERQLRIVADLLKVAQVDAGKVNLRKTIVDLGMFIREVVLQHQSILANRQQTLRMIPKDFPHEVYIDEPMIHMVLENLIDNASKYSDSRTNITVKLTSTKNSVSIAIVDQGIGIDPENSGKLFQKFSRLDNSLATKVGGSGLGLYWVRKIIELHGGSVTFEPTLPKGTTFIVTLPKEGEV